MSEEKWMEQLKRFLSLFSQKLEEDTLSIAELQKQEKLILAYQEKVMFYFQAEERDKIKQVYDTIKPYIDLVQHKITLYNELSIYGEKDAIKRCTPDMIQNCFSSDIQALEQEIAEMKKEVEKEEQFYFKMQKTSEYADVSFLSANEQNCAFIMDDNLLSYIHLLPICAVQEHLLGEFYHSLYTQLQEWKQSRQYNGMQTPIEIENAQATELWKRNLSSKPIGNSQSFMFFISFYYQLKALNEYYEKGIINEIDLYGCKDLVTAFKKDDNKEIANNFSSMYDYISRVYKNANQKYYKWYSHYLEVKTQITQKECLLSEYQQTLAQDIVFLSLYHDLLDEKNLLSWISTLVEKIFPFFEELKRYLPCVKTFSDLSRLESLIGADNIYSKANRYLHEIDSAHSEIQSLLNSKEVQKQNEALLEELDKNNIEYRNICTLITKEEESRVSIFKRAQKTRNLRLLEMQKKESKKKREYADFELDQFHDQVATQIVDILNTISWQDVFELLEIEDFQFEHPSSWNPKTPYQMIPSIVELRQQLEQKRSLSQEKLESSGCLSIFQTCGDKIVSCYDVIRKVNWDAFSSDVRYAYQLYQQLPTDPNYYLERRKPELLKMIGQSASIMRKK